jgi:large subunit ribosomal protein L10e
MRENPLASGAGADRFQTGMAKAFGKPIGRAARVKPGQKVASVYVTKEKIPVTKKALKRAMMKLSGKYKMQITENPKMPK